MIRRTLALTGVAILATAGLAGPAAADSSIAAIPVLHMQEAGIELDTTRGVLEIDGDAIEINNPTGGTLNLAGYELKACNATTGLTFLVTNLTTSDAITAGGVFVIANDEYADTDGPAPQRVFETTADQFLSQLNGGLQLENTNTGDIQQVKWGTPHVDCQGFPSAPTPSDSDSLHYDLGTDTWSVDTETIGSN